MSTYTHFRKIMWLVAIGVAVVLIEVVGIWWLSGRMLFRSMEIASKQTLFLQAETDRLEFSSLQVDYDLVRGFASRLDAALPDQEQLFGVIAEMNRIAERTGNRQTIGIEGSFPTASEVAGVSFMSFSAELGGTYQSLRSYLNELKAAPFLAKIESVSITNQENISFESRIKLTGKIFLKRSGG